MFEIAVEGFSGPLDLLCHMIDGGEIEASKISVSEVISIYARYLAENGELSISQTAEFISQAAHLLRQKASSLLPKYVDDGEDDAIYDDDDGAGVEDLLERYRPYRTAAEKLVELKNIADRRRFRNGERLEPMFDLGNLYALSLQWLDLLHRYMSDREAARAAAFLDDSEDYPLDGGLPAEIPDEVQVENRMERIMESMEAFPEGLSMRFLLAQERGVGPLVVTLLALLELSRRNKLTLTQKELFSDVFITYRAV